MSERIPGQEETMNEASRQFEKAWKVFYHPEDYKHEEFLAAKNFLKEQIPNYQSIIQLEKDGDDPTVSHSDLELVVQGLFHYKYRLPYNRFNN